MIRIYACVNGIRNRKREVKKRGTSFVCMCMYVSAYISSCSIYADTATTGHCI